MEKGRIAQLINLHQSLIQEETSDLENSLVGMESDRESGRTTPVVGSGSRRSSVSVPTHPPDSTSKYSPPPSPNLTLQPPAKTLSSMLGSQTTSSTSGGNQGGICNPQVIQGPIKVLPMTAAIPKFSNEDTSYSARDFICLCEDVMRTSSITDPVEKMSFVRLNVKEGSDVARLMQANVLSEPMIDRDYQLFRANFLDLFGDDTQDSMVKGVSAIVDRLISVVGTGNASSALGHSTRISEDMVNYLRDNGWAPNGVMTLEQVRKSYELFSYMAALQFPIRQKSLALTFEPTDKVHKFAFKLMSKLKETEEEREDSPLVATTLAGIETPPNRAYACSASNVRKEPVCSYCKQTGHRAHRCYVRKRDRWKANMPRGSVQASREAGNQRQGKRTHADATQQRALGYWVRGAPASDSYCEHHNTTGHSLGECFAGIKKSKPDLVGQKLRHSGTQSGEASRPVRHDPP